MIFCSIATAGWNYSSQLPTPGARRVSLMRQTRFPVFGLKSAAWRQS